MSMPKCRKCSGEITTLIEYDVVQRYRDTSVSPDNKVRKYTSRKWGVRRYYCPKCHNKLFNKESTAIKFLRGGNTNSKW
jgi:hypothetical protein